ncbi:cytochrome-c peroxidase [Sulfurovum sp.]|uniref:cytochrome-c peroxidase n=1 Tax=Sulfurovum sp. TaxID=1969726 RepID=UPI0028680321|nr:cytochrome-c peroxidase [Sulfurovum sp.]
MMRKNDVISFMILFLSTTVFIFAELIPLPLTVEADDKKVQLGKKLFLDPILSKDKSISCLSCHKLLENGADNIPYTEGIRGQKGGFNSPTVYNAVYNFRQFWDGRAKNLTEQALMPVINPVEMGNTIEQVLQDLKAEKVYRDMFNEIFKDGITENNLAEVLVEFEKKLITPNAPFDKYLRGDKKALNAQAQLGYELFKTKGCISCHNGINLGGNLYNKFGIYKDAKSIELGRYNQTQKDEDKYVFKVPSLRNVDITAPYMHDGRVETLEDAVNIMTKYQLGRPMDSDDLKNLVAFLKTLTGELPDIVKDINATHK